MGERRIKSLGTKLLQAVLQNLVERTIDIFHKWRRWHGNEARMLFSRSVLVFNYQTDMFLCLIFAKIAK